MVQCGDDEPAPFYDISWLAVENAGVGTILEVLELSDAVPETWERGWSAVWGDYWDFDAPLDASLSRVYITPLVQGWRLAIGGWIGEGGGQKLDGLVDFCRRLSRTCGEAHAFTSQNRMGWYSWLLARGGELFRKFWCDEQLLVDEGEPVPAEQQFNEKLGMESLVMSIAGEWSINPASSSAEFARAGAGLLAVTPWGREHGIPRRPLG